jgi:REP element-mobilizing transposase RayT
MCMDTQYTKHVTYELAYRLVWCPKYRKKILRGEIATFVEQEIRRICEANTWTIGALHVPVDHVHLFIAISREPALPFLWKAGRITGWIEALMENSPHTFRSHPAKGRITALQEV